MSARSKRTGKAPPAIPGVNSGPDMARAAFAFGRARRRRPKPSAPQGPTFDDFERAERRRGRA